MSTVELKKNLIEKITQIENEDLLNDINRLIELESSDTDVYILNEEEQQAISEAEAQIKNGQILTDEEAKKDIAEWLKSNLDCKSRRRSKSYLRILEGKK